MDSKTAPITRCQIMIAEDEPVIAIDLQTRLERLGYVVTGTVDTGRDAIDRVGEFQANLVFMDIHLRDQMDGIQAAAVIQKEYDIPVVFMTAHSDDATILQARNVQPFGYLLKPCEDRELRVAVEMALYRHRMESKLKRVERWLATTLNSVGDGVISTDIDGRVNFMNSVARNLIGCTMQDASDQPFETVFRVVHESSREPIESVVQRVLRQGIPIELDENAVLIAKDGKECFVSNSASPMRSENGTMTGVVVIFRDVTARVLAEREKLRAYDQLQQSQKMEVVGRLAGGIAHDFNNLMTVVLGQCSIMLNEERSVKDRMRLDTIEKAGARAADLTSQLLNFARRQVFRPERLSLNGVLIDMGNMLARLIGDNITLNFTTTGDDTTVFADPSQMGQILLNLIVNSRDAMPTGGAIDVSIARIEVRPGSSSSRTQWAAGDYVSLTVTDNGVGMDEFTLAHLFEPYFTTKGVGKGTGLGLASVQGIVAQCGGHIEVESGVGTGSTFSIFLPAAPRAETGDAKQKNVKPLQPVGVLAGKTVLFVEDSDDVRELYFEVLSGTGCALMVASGAKEALAVLKTSTAPLDILVTDICMPEMDGIELATVLREQNPTLPILFLSGYDRELLRGKSFGVDAKAGFLQKPAKMADLIEKVRGLLDLP